MTSVLISLCQAPCSFDDTLCGSGTGDFLLFRIFFGFQIFHEIFLTKPGYYEFFQAKKFEIRNIFRKNKKIITM